MATHLREESSIVPWATLFINVVNKEAPPEAMGDEDERDQHPWWKTKKWAYSNLNRLFVRYVGSNDLEALLLTLEQIWKSNEHDYCERRELQGIRTTFHKPLCARNP